MRTLVLCLILNSGLAHAAGLRSTDICTVRPDLCDTAAPTTRARTKATTRRAPASTRAKVARTITRAQSPARQARVNTCRPASVAMTEANSNLPTCGSRGPASVTTASVQSISFSSYMNANAANPALSRKVAGYQSAFKDTAKAATFTAPNLDGTGTRETSAAPAVASDQPTRNNQ